MRTKIQQRLQHTPPKWAGLFLLTFILGHLYVLLEWVFTVTKASYLDMFPLLANLKVLLFGSALAAGLALLGLGALLLAGRLAGLRRWPRLFFWLGSLIPAVMLAALLLLLVDNFTYTLFSSGIATTRGAWRGLYTFLFVALLGWSNWDVLGAAAWLHRRFATGLQRPKLWIGLGAWLVLWIALPLALTEGQATVLDATQATPSSRPHILWITVDGLSASHLSLYGYVRDTTPALRALADSSLVVENAFPNADKTAGSLVSLFTGKSPLETRVMYKPDILVGEESYQHLPGILRAQGYYAIQYGFPYFVDAYKLNMLDSFDEANGRALSNSPLSAALQQYLPGELGYFAYETGDRLSSRLGHIFFIQEMPDPRHTVVSPARNQTDDEKVDALLSRLEQLDRPTFIHLHLLEAHGPLFTPEEKVFSRGLAFKEQGEWNSYFYDDAILEVDHDIGRVVAALEEHGLLDETLLIIGSDHAMAFDQLQRVPLLVRFPGGEMAGRMPENVQGLDVAPTILDYLGLPQPEWMAGQSLLSAALEERVIFGAGVGPLAQNENSIWVVDPQRSKAPFYQFGTISLIDCNAWYELDLVTGNVSRGEVTGHTAPCPEQAMLSSAEAFTRMVAYLKQNGFEVEALEEMRP